MRPSTPALLLGRPFRLYLAGHGLIVAGAWSIEATGSVLPMAFAASGALMLSMPFLRALIERARPGSPPFR